MAKIISVLKEGKEFTPNIAMWFHDQLPDNLESVCMTDVPYISSVNTIPLKFNYKGWWNKMEIFNPNRADIGNDDLLYFDLDTVILPNANISGMCSRKPFTVLRDWYHPTYINSSIMYIPKEIKHDVWEAFRNHDNFIVENFRMITMNEFRDPFRKRAHIYKIRSYFDKHLPDIDTSRITWTNILGDQGFINLVIQKKLFWNSPYIISYKRHIVKKGQRGYNKFSTGNGTLPKRTEIVCFHGDPRPFELNKYWIPNLSKYSDEGIFY